jgi:hypothetical protein
VWAIWLDAIVYYSEIFEIFCSMVNELETDYAFSVAILQGMFNASNELKMLKSDLAYIHTNFTFLSQSIKKVRKCYKFAAGNSKRHQWHLR